MIRLSSMVAKLSASIAVLALSAGVAVACPHGKHGGDCKNRECKLKKPDLVAELGIEGERAEQVAAMQARHREERKALKAQMSELKANQKLELADVLTSDELESLEQKRSYRKGGHHHGLDADGHPKPKQCKGKNKEGNSYH